MVSEFHYLDQRRFSDREDEHGKFVRVSDQKNTELLHVAISKPSSGASVNQSIKDKRGYLLPVRLGQNWVRSTQQLGFWESAVVTDLEDDVMEDVALTLMACYHRHGIRPLGLYEYLNEEQRLILDARIKSHGNRGQRMVNVGIVNVGIVDVGAQDMSSGTSVQPDHHHQ